MKTTDGEMGDLVTRFMAIDPQMELRTIAVFLEAARSPGISLAEISKRTGIAHPRVSICAAKLGFTNRGGGKSYGLAVTYADREDPRIKRLAPTEFGQGILVS